MLKIVFSCFVGFAVAAVAAKPADSPEALVQAVQSAERAGDVLTLRKLVSPAFVQHHASGTVEPLAGYLADRSSSASNPSTGRSYLERDVQWRKVGGTAIRTSIARIRGAKAGTDVWVRSTAVAVREAGTWKLLNLDSALLAETPIYDGPPAKDLPTTGFASKEGGAIRFLTRGGQTYLAFQHDREVPLIAIGPNLYWSGSGSSLSIARDASGRAVSVTRKYGDRIAWVALPAS